MSALQSFVTANSKKATLELKSEFKQAIDNAKWQYKKDRPPKDPKTRKTEPLLAFGRRALVHFAVSQEEVWMTTRLAGRDTFFLPFNKGNEGGSGNPPNPDGYATDYLWKQVFQRDAWLDILGRFVHLQKEEKEDWQGKRYTKETLIFPRYHQWDAVNRLVATARAEGPGHKYLIQHSAGSGKSNSIAWTAHRLASLHNDQDQRVFDSVVVITDRTVLDAQLQETIYQFEHAEGVVCRISREEGEGSKSAQLAQALAEIIARLNDLFAGEGLTDKDRLNYLNTVKDKVMESAAVVSQIEANDDPKQIMLGDFPDAVQGAVMDSLGAHNGLAETILRDGRIRGRFVRLLLDAILSGRRTKGGVESRL